MSQSNNSMDHRRLDEQLDDLLPLVSKPSRYLGNEFHVIRKTPTREMVQWCLILPEVYEIGMSHWGLKILYDILNRRPDSLAERCFSPWFDMESQMRRNEIPLYALESKRPVGDFDFVGFSLQYELTYTNVLQCLDLAGIPLRSEDRTDAHPLVIAGGPVVSNPEPLSDFIDIYLIGDGEESIHQITETYRELRGRPREEVLRGLARVPGLYVPSLYEARYDEGGRFLGLEPRFADTPRRVQRQFIIDLDSAPVPEAPIVPLQGIVQNRLSVEVVRGCTQGCRFCQAGYLYRPIRERSVETIAKIADTGIRNSGWSEVGLTSLSTADYTQLEPLADVLNARFSKDRVGISLPSLRADSFGIQIADKVRETKRTGFTFAPEVGSERLRLAVNKLIRDDEFFRAAEIAYERGWRLIKMYFMVGLPTETWEDVDGIVHFVNTVREIGRRHGPRNTVNASVGAFVPKSHTPFQWDAFESIDLLREKIDHIRRKCHSRWSRVKWHDVETSHLEAVFSMGDRRLGRSIEWAYRKGARFDGWTEHFKYDLWMRAFEETGIDVSMQTQKRAYEDALPWDHIDIRVAKKWLERERRKTEEAVLEMGKSLTADCRHGDCTSCGIPGLPFDTQLTPPLDRERLEAMIETAKAQAPPAAPDGPVSMWRITFHKLGNARYLSHLELGTVLSRAFRMARVPVAYSRGHSPRPLFHFGPSLSVGIEASAEAFDAEVHGDWSSEYTDRLNRVLPEGVRIVGIAPVERIPGRRTRSLASLARRAVYHLDLGRLPAETRRRMVATSEEFLGSTACVVDRTFWSPAASREATDWESPMDPLAAATATRADAGPAGQAIGETDDSGPNWRGDTERDRAREGREAKRVDLKKAVVGLRWRDANDPDPADGSRSGSARLDLELYLQRDDGQVANPKVLLERLFRLSPEEQARVRITRASILSEDGEPLAGSRADRCAALSAP